MGARNLWNVAARALGLLAAFALLGCGEGDTGRTPLRGELSVYIADNPDGTSETSYSLRDASGVELPLLMDRELDLAPGTEVEVWGEKTSKGVVVASLVPVGLPVEPLISGSAYPTRSFAFVMVNLGLGVNITSQQAMGKLVNDASSLRNLLLYESYGRQNITAQVFGPLNYTMSSCSNSDVSRLASDLRSQVQGTFQHYQWYFGSRASTCSWSGLGSVGTPNSPTRDSWYNASTNCVVLGQESGHNVGQQHSSSLACPGAPFADNPNLCTSSEFGDRFDVMGGGCRHTNAWQKAHQGWFGGCNGVNITATGTFTLLPYERRCDGPQFLKIKAPKARPFQRPAGGGGGAGTENLDYYYLELRTPLDFDGTVGNSSALTPQVLIHVASNLRDRSQTGVHTFLLDMTPNTSSVTDAALAQGQTFTDPAGGLSITAQAVSATQATIVVQSASGTGAPTCLDGSTFTPPGQGPESCVNNPPTPIP